MLGTVSVAGFEAARATEKAGVAEEEGAQETGRPMAAAGEAAPAAAPSPPPAAAAPPPAAVPEPLAAAVELLTHSGVSVNELGLVRSAAQAIPCQQAHTYIHAHYTYRGLVGHEHHLQLQDLVPGHNLEFLKMAICCWLATRHSPHEVAAQPEVVADRLQVPLSVLHRLETAIANALMWGDFEEFERQLMGPGPAAAPAARNQLYPSAGLLSCWLPTG